MNSKINSICYKINLFFTIYTSEVTFKTESDVRIEQLTVTLFSSHYLKASSGSLAFLVNKLSHYHLWTQ